MELGETEVSISHDSKDEDDWRVVRWYVNENLRLDTDDRGVSDPREGLKQGFQLRGRDLGATDFDQFLWVGAALDLKTIFGFTGLGKPL